MQPDPLDGLMAEASGALCARIWRGYIAHALLFYRQNKLGDLKRLPPLARKLKLGPSGDLARPGRPEGRGWPLALRAMRCSDLRRAAALLDRALREDDAGAAFLVLRGLLRWEDYWGSVRFDEKALADFERACELNPSSVWGHLFAGMAHEMHRRYAKAVVCFERASALRPDWSWPLVMRGICRWYMAEFEASVRDFERAAELDPSSELPLLFMARAKADLRDPSLVKDLDRALKLAPRSGFALSWRGRAMFVLKRTPEALEDLRRSIPPLPDYDRGWSWLGVSCVELGRWKEAARLLRRARRLNPHYPTTLYPLAHACIKLGRWDEAAEALKAGAFIDRHGVWVEHRISMSHPNPACLRSLADLNLYLERRPREAWALAWRGQTELLLQNYRRALKDLDLAVELAPKDPWARMWRGESWRRMGYASKALADFGAALTLSPQLSWAHAGRGQALLALGRPRAALAALERSLELQGFCQPALAWRGEARHLCGDYRGAVSDFEAALELHPQDHWIHRWLWRARARLGDYKGALEALSVLSRSSGAASDEVWALIGWAQGRLGLEEAAIRSLARSLEANPAQPLALWETACWWGRHGEAARAAFVLERLGRSGSPPPRHLTLSRAEALCSGAPASAWFEPGRLTEYARRTQSALCRAGLERGDHEAALAACAEAPLRERDVQGSLFRGWLKLRARDYGGAVEEASRALDPTLDPLCAPAYWLRARAKAAGGEAGAAREDLARLRALCPGRAQRTDFVRASRARG